MYNQPRLMPLYEYRCGDCKKVFEIIQKFSDPPGGTCTACGSTSVQRLISRSSFHLKGGGWYVTDYKGKSSQPSSSEGSSGGSSQTESKKEASASTSSKEKASSSEKKSGS